MKPSLTIIGSVNVDHILQVQQLPQVGETVTGGVYRPTFGGKGANCAVAAARAGGAVEFVGCVGADASGAEIRRVLSGHQVGLTHLHTVSNVASGQALIFVGESGANMIGVAPGANHALEPLEVERVLTSLPTSGWILLQNEILPEVNLTVLRRARQIGAKVVYNFAPAVSFPAAELRGVEVLVVNETEARALACLPEFTSEEAVPVARSLLKLGVRRVVVTLGGDGLAYADEEGSGRLAAHAVTAVDTTAAGDIFCGALGVALAEGRGFVEALRFGMRAAAISVTRRGSMDSAPTRAEIEAFDI